jgi:hypothetical protein
MFSLACFRPFSAPSGDPGGGNSILRSIRPGRSRAGSRMSIRFVAMMTCEARQDHFLLNQLDGFESTKNIKVRIAGMFSLACFRPFSAPSGVELVQQLEHRPLHFRVAAATAATASGRADRVDLVHDKVRIAGMFSLACFRPFSAPSGEPC